MDKRKNDRLVLKLPVFYRSSTIAPWIGPINLCNISGSGLLFLADKKIAAAKMIQIKIELPDKNPPIIVDSKLVWERPSLSPKGHLIGLRFYKMAIDDRKRFVKFICENILLLNLGNFNRP